MTALDDLRTALATVERWRDRASGHGKDWRATNGYFKYDPRVEMFVAGERHATITSPSRKEDAVLLASAVSILLDEGSGVAATLRDAINAWEEGERADYTSMLDITRHDALRLARLVNGIEAGR